MALTKLGGQKIAAGKIGISLEEYQQNIKSGLKWCFSCQTWLKLNLFNQSKNARDGKDNRCISCRRAFDRKRYQPIPIGIRKPRGFPPVPGRDGDKNQARNRVNYAVSRNKLPHTRNIPCVDCGHLGPDGVPPRKLRLHEYDHYKGYDAVNHLEVECVCVPCHVKRERQRKQERQYHNHTRRSNSYSIFRNVLRYKVVSFGELKCRFTFLRKIKSSLTLSLILQHPSQRNQCLPNSRLNYPGK